MYRIHNVPVPPVMSMYHSSESLARHMAHSDHKRKGWFPGLDIVTGYPPGSPERIAYEVEVGEIVSEEGAKNGH